MSKVDRKISKWNTRRQINVSWQSTTLKVDGNDEWYRNGNAVINTIRIKCSQKKNSWWEIHFIETYEEKVLEYLW